MFQGTGFGNQQNTPTAGVFGAQTQQGGFFGNTNNTNPTQPQGLFGGGGPSQGSAGLFGNTQTQQPQTGNLFGGGIQESTHVFGGASNALGNNNQNQAATGPVFGNNNNNMMKTPTFSGPTQGSFGNNGGVFGNNNSGGQTPFGGNQNTGGIFGANNTNANTAFKNNTGVFGNNNTGNAFNTGNNANPSVFGNTPNTTQTGGNLFGNNQNTNTGGNVLGNTNNNAGNTGFSAFGGNTNKSVFGSNTTGGNLFGQQPAQGQGNIAFGGNTPSFGNIAAPAFGNTATNTAFGNNTNTTLGFVGGNNNTNQGSFGNNANTANTNTGFFGNKNQGLVNVQPNTNTGLGFGVNTANTNQGFGFINSPAPNNNTFGNTSWGVPTTNLGNVGGTTTKLTPLKPKNHKIDGKHMVKCITLLDQNTGFCKNQLRIRFIMSGGTAGGAATSLGFSKPQAQQGGMFNYGGQQQQQDGSFFGQGNTGASTNTFGSNQPIIINPTTGGGLFGNNATNTGFGASINTPSFGANTTQAANNMPFGNNNSAFKTGGGLFGNAPATGTTNTGFFGNQTPNNMVGANLGTNTNNLGTGGGLLGNTSGGMFGNNQNQGATQGMFGNTTANTGGMFGNTAANTGGMFGSGAPNTTGMFGNAANTGTGMYGNTATTGGGMFGNNGNTAPGGMFGNTANTGMFGNTATTSGGMFGNTATQPQGSLFGANTQNKGSLGLNFGAPQANTTGGGLFGQSAQKPSTGMFGSAPVANQFGAQPQNFGGFSQQAQNTGMLGQQQQNLVPSNFLDAIVNAVFNKDFFAKLIKQEGNTPYDQLKNQAKNKPNIFNSQIFSNKNEQNQNIGYIPRYNKYNNALLSSMYNFNHSPYLYTDLDNREQQINKRQTQDLKLKFANKNQTIDMKSIRAMKQPTYDQDLGYQRILPKNFTQQIVSKHKTNRPQSKFQRQTSNIKQSLIKKNYVNDNQLPIVDQGYQITPSLDQLKQKTSSQLKRVPNVIIQNQFGKIMFKTPINLYKKPITDSIKIQQNSIDIIDSEWDDKKCQLIFYNFGNYTNLSESQKVKIEKKINKWVQKHNMHYKQFDKDKGDLNVQIY